MPKFAANLTMLYHDCDFLDRFQAAADSGFKGVEYLFPYDFSAKELVDRLQHHGLTQVLHNLPAGDWGGGERGIACHPDRTRPPGNRYALRSGCRVAGSSSASLTDARSRC